MTTETDAATGAAEPAVAGGSMDDTLKTLYRERMADVDLDADEVETGGEVEPAQGRQRGPDGKFLPKAKATDEAQDAGHQPEEQPSTEVTEPATAQARPHDAVPNTWRKELAADYAKLPESVRQEIHRRETDFHKGIGQYREAAGFGQQIAQELLPYQEQMTKAQLHPRQVIKELAAAWNTLANGQPQDKASLVLQLVKDYGIDFSSLGTDPQQGTAQQQDDPKLATALQRIEKLEGTLTAQERQRAAAEYASNLDLVEKFMADTANEHAQAVRGEMAALLRSGQASDLKDAYDKAVWINPEIRKLLLAKQEKERADKAAREAAAARKAAGANVTRRGTPPVSPKTGTMEDTLRSRYRELIGS